MSTPVLGVVLAGPGAVDGPALLRALQRVGQQARVVRRCVDLAELLAGAHVSTADVAIVSSSLRRLDRDAVATLHGHGLGVVVVCEDLAELVAWRQCGADATVTGEDPGAIVAAVLALGPRGSCVRARVAPGIDVGPVAEWRTGEGAALPSSPVGQLIDTAERRRGQVVAVWGPTGAPGRTTVALALADELARAGQRTLLVDADTYGAAVGIHLGLLDDTSGLAAATRLAALGRLDTDALHRAAVAIESGLAVLTGLARPARWPELREASLQAVLELATACFDRVVVDVGFGLGAGVTPGSGLGPPDRDEATRAVLAVCDTLLAVGAGDPVGVVRLARELPVATDLAPAARPVVVVNRARRSSLGPRPQRQAAEALGGAVAPGRLATLPDDPAACDTALLHGRTLAEVAPDSRLRAAVRSLAVALDPAASGPGVRRQGARRAVRPLRGMLRRVG